MTGEAVTYKTIRATSEGQYSERRSRFLSFALPVKTPEEAMQAVKAYRKTYFDARHVCWAYMLGASRETFRVNDDGEPSSTAGKPLLGQINSYQLTDIIVIVVRYFGGVELGTSGLTVAYRKAASEALAAAEITTNYIMETLAVSFACPELHHVMRIIKEEQPDITSQTFDVACCMSFDVKKDRIERLKSRLMTVPTLKIKEE